MMDKLGPAFRPNTRTLALISLVAFLIMGSTQAPASFFAFAINGNYLNIQYRELSGTGWRAALQQDFRQFGIEANGKMLANGAIGDLKGVGS